MKEPRLLSRRALLEASSAAAAAAALGTAGCSSTKIPTDGTPDAATADGPFRVPADDASRALFRHGVASADPLPDGVLLWTRATPAAGAESVTVRWRVAKDPQGATIVAKGVATTDASKDFTVQIDARGLEARTTYYYQFDVGTSVSPIGRARTAPSSTADRLRVAVVSCASYAHGHFHVYQEIAERADLDLVIHLGDYIYEYGNGEYGSVRTYDPPHEIVKLEDYRRRHAHYRGDAKLRALHQQHTMVTVWDDHESADNAYDTGAFHHTEGAEGTWKDRAAVAKQAYREWVPARWDGGHLWREVTLGDLATLVVLDTRNDGRVKQATTASDPGFADASRTMISAAQEAWLGERLAASKATFTLLGQQVIFGQLPGAVDPRAFNSDAWDGYPAARSRVMDLLKKTTASTPVILTGDVHSSWSMDIAADPTAPTAYDPATGRGAVAVELVTPAVSSPGFTGDQSGNVSLLKGLMPHLKFAELTLRGYIVLDVTKDRLQADYFHLPEGELTKETGAAPTKFTIGLNVRAGERHLTIVTTPAAARTDGPKLAPV